MFNWRKYGNASTINVLLTYIYGIASPLNIVYFSWHDFNIVNDVSLAVFKKLIEPLSCWIFLCTTLLPIPILYICSIPIVSICFQSLLKRLWILIRWLREKPSDQDLQSFQIKDKSKFSKTRVNICFIITVFGNVWKNHESENWKMVSDLDSKNLHKRFTSFLLSLQKFYPP